MLHAYSAARLFDRTPQDLVHHFSVGLDERLVEGTIVDISIVRKHGGRDAYAVPLSDLCCIINLAVHQKITDEPITAMKHISPDAGKAINHVGPKTCTVFDLIIADDAISDPCTPLVALALRIISHDRDTYRYRYMEVPCAGTSQDAHRTQVQKLAKNTNCKGSCIGQLMHGIVENWRTKSCAARGRRAQQARGAGRAKYNDMPHHPRAVRLMADNKQILGDIIGVDGPFQGVRRRTMAVLKDSTTYKTLDACCAEVLDNCLQMGGKDNMTMVLVTFPGFIREAGSVVDNDLQDTGRMLCRVGEKTCHLGLGCAGPDCRPESDRGPCCPGVQATSHTIDDHASAMKLTEAAACLNQTIKVQWQGFVGLTEPIIVGARTSLEITGVDTDSEVASISGWNETQLIRVQAGASVTLRNLWLRDGFAEAGENDNLQVGGGAVKVSKGGQLLLEGCQFWFNRAFSHGGAIYNRGNVKSRSSAFFKNAADFGGAIFNFRQSNSICTGCIFANNTAVDGGAIYNDNSSFDCGNSAFTANRASNDSGHQGYGGAVYNSGYFTCTTSTFTNNTAQQQSGAVENIGDFDCFGSTFTSNIAGYGGYYEPFRGGAVSNSGNFNCFGSRFSFNNGYYGGAINNYGNFTCRNSTFASNTGSLGGAIYNEGGSSDFITSTFTSNRADQGGAVANAAGEVSCSRSTFASNTAHEVGGAIYNNYGGALTFHNATFTSNTAVYDGGAICNSLGTVTCSSSAFTYNTATEFGGAIINEEGNFTCGNSTFTLNSAHGGAIYVNADGAYLMLSDFNGNIAKHYGGSITVEQGAYLKCTKSNFQQSTAIKGGTVYAATGSELKMSSVAIQHSSSTDDGAILLVGNMIMNSSLFENNSGAKGAAMYLAQAAIANISSTSFSFNSATETGGAVYLEPSVTGHINTCNFTNNSSPVGGALSLAPVVETRNFDISHSVFTSNTATVGAGGAIIQQGTATMLNVNVDPSTSFVNNVAQCCYSGTSATHSEIPCNDASTGFGTGWSCCNKRQYLVVDSNNDHTCVTCDTHELDCSSIGITVSTLPLAAGFWRETFYQEDLHCAVCAPGYASLPGYRCVECTSGATAATITILAVVALATLLLLWLLCSKSTGVVDGVDSAQAVGAAAGPSSKLARVGVLLMQRFRIPIVVIQVLTQYISITGLTLPLKYLEFLHAVDFLSLDMRWLTSPGCVADINFYGRLLVAKLAPLVISALIFSPRFYLWIVSRRRLAVAPKLQQVVARDVNAFLVFTFLIFSGVSLTVFETFGCDELKFTGKSYLRADYSIECGDDEGLHTKFSIYAAFMIMVYPVGIPVLYASILWRSVRQCDRTQLPSRLATASSFLWRPYKGRAYYWETVECLRRLMLAGLLVFIMPGEPGQSAVACLFVFFTAMVYEQIHPHQQGMDKWLYTLGYAILFGSMFTSLLMQVRWVEGGSEQAVGNLLIALNVLLLVMALVQVALVYRGLRPAAGPLRQNSLFDHYSGSSRYAARSTAAQDDDASAPSPMS
ncbi:hypothetical protein JKP88DRAFT_245958 [Tribonema minus]|uniref:Uncharacterized protein n=1 Tax=Tribonema minus TaxID=303371 RepID=A0A836CFC3_9STRA|nr:hypothetical protein JKP88DRAFT_245958 [Tribonema minus]